MLRQLTQNDIYSIEALKKHADGYFFSPDTMRFFKSRVSETIYNGVDSVYFVTSERGPNMQRAYTVRRFDLKTRSIETVNEFCRMSRGGAHGAASRLALNETKNNAKVSA